MKTFQVTVREGDSTSAVEVLAETIDIFPATADGTGWLYAYGLAGELRQVPGPFGEAATVRNVPDLLAAFAPGTWLRVEDRTTLADTDPVGRYPALRAELDRAVADRDKLLAALGARDDAFLRQRGELAEVIEQRDGWIKRCDDQNVKLGELHDALAARDESLAQWRAELDQVTAERDRLADVVKRRHAVLAELVKAATSPDVRLTDPLIRAIAVAEDSLAGREATSE